MFKINKEEEKSVLASIIYGVEAKMLDYCQLAAYLEITHYYYEIKTILHTHRRDLDCHIFINSIKKLYFD